MPVVPRLHPAAAPARWLITHHRVYWGWVGFNKLHNAINKARQ
jgi:hypothetical protein